MIQCCIVKGTTTPWHAFCNAPARLLTSQPPSGFWQSSFTRSRHLSFRLPRFCFPSTVICNIFLVSSSVSRLCTCHTISTSSLRGILPSGTCVPLSRCLECSHDLVSSFLLPTATHFSCVQFHFFLLCNCCLL